MDAYVIPLVAAAGGGFIVRNVVRLERQSSVVLLYRSPDPTHRKDIALMAVVPTAGVLVFFGDQPPEKLPPEPVTGLSVGQTKRTRTLAKVAPI